MTTEPTQTPFHEPARLLRALDSVPGPAPVHLWHPPYCGEIDIRISRNGRWFHEGNPIRRHGLVQLFSSLLRLEPDGRHVLVTPLEMLGIVVEDCPFVAQLLEVSNPGGQQELQFILNTGERVSAGADHAIVVEGGAEEPHPVLMVRDGLKALITRSVFYELVQLAKESELKGRRVLTVASQGSRFELGQF